MLKFQMFSTSFWYLKFVIFLKLCIIYPHLFCQVYPHFLYFQWPYPPPVPFLRWVNEKNLRYFWTVPNRFWERLLTIRF